MDYRRIPADELVSATASCGIVEQGQAQGSHLCRGGRGRVPLRADTGNDTKLRRLTLQLTRRFESELRKAGVATTQALLLSQLVASEPVGLRAFARVMGIVISALTRNLRLTLDAGWVALRAGDGGRSRGGPPNDAGRRQLKKACPRRYAAQRSTNDLPGSRRIAALHSLPDECVNSSCSRTGAPSGSTKPQDAAHLKEIT